MSTKAAMQEHLLPPHAWDSHLHVIDEERFPFAPGHAYRPKRANLTDLRDFHSKLGHDVHPVFVAASIYGTDNSIILEALSRIPGQGRAVVTIDPATVTDEELEKMNSLGACAVRINLVSVGANPSKEDLCKRLWDHANRVRGMGWAVQVYLNLGQLPLIADEIPQLGVRIVIDHMGSPDPSQAASSQPGYKNLIDLLQKGFIWVKISGAYRCPGLPDLDAHARKLIKTNPKQVVWASDWPHTGSKENNPGGDPNALQEFRKIDDPAFIKQCKGWCDEDPLIVHQLFVDNPRRLWTGQD